MPIVTITDFKDDIALPQASQQAVQENVNRHIAKYEQEFLEQVLGYEMATAFTAGLLLDPIPVKWLELRNGATFTDNTVVYKWPGIKTPIACYVYYHIRRDDAINTTPSGDTTGKAENAKVISSARKMLEAWNKMVKLNRTMWAFLYVNREAYSWKGIPDNDTAYTINDFDL